ncbi:MAG: SDR family oxidoreductase, partial [Planctomycetia bacterium]
IPDGPLPEPPEEIQAAVYCPGSITLRSFRSLQPADFRQDLEINLVGAVRFLQVLQPRLKGPEGGTASVVLFSTVAVGQGMPMHASVAAAKAAVEGLTRALAARHPLKRIGTPADIAALARFLVSAESDWVTGQVFGVDGGMSTLRC